MVSKRTKALVIIKRFLKKVEEALTIDKAILFGSYAKGNPKRWSDIDLAIISREFEDKNYFERLVMLGKLAWEAKTTQIEALGFTPKEYKNPSPFDLLCEIKSKGLVVYPSK